MTQLLDCCTPGSHPFDDQVLILDFRILDFRHCDSNVVVLV